MKNRKFIMVSTTILASSLLMGCGEGKQSVNTTEIFDIPLAFNDCIVADIRTKTTKKGDDIEGGNFAFRAMRCPGSDTTISYHESQGKASVNRSIVVSDVVKDRSIQEVRSPSGIDLKDLKEFKVGGDTFKLENPEDVKIVDGQVFRKVKMR